MKRVEKIKKVERLAAEMLPVLYKNRHSYGMGTSTLKEFVPMAVEAACEIVRESRKS
jgi:hypothetical protein